MKKVFILFCTLLIYSLSFSQIQNADFEQWEERDDRLLPVGWSYSYYSGYQPYKELTVKNDYIALKLYTSIGGVRPASIISHIANGICDAVRGKGCGNPINFRPKFLTGFYNLYSISYDEPRVLTKDTAMIRVVLKKYNLSKKSADTLVNQLIPLYDVINQKSLIPFQQELFYKQNLEELIPDTAVIIIATNHRFFSKKLSYLGFLKYNELIIDDLNLTENPSALDNISNNFSTLTLFPNPTNTTLNVQSTKAMSKYIIYQSNGTKVLETSATESIDVSALPEGLYLLEAWDKEGRRALKKFEKR